MFESGSDGGGGGPSLYIHSHRVVAWKDTRSAARGSSREATSGLNRQANPATRIIQTLTQTREQLLNYTYLPSLDDCVG